MELLQKILEHMIARDKTCCRAHLAPQVEVFEVSRLDAGSPKS
jgi:hypothetical protein